MGSCISELRTNYEKNKRGIQPATVSLTGRAFGYLVDCLGDIEIDRVGPGHIERFQSWLLDAGRTKTTVNIYCKILRPAFRWAVRRDLLAEDPFARVKLLRAPRILVRIYEQQQLTQLLKLANPLWRLRILLAVTCGLRRGEVLNLTTADVDIDQGVLTVQAKDDTRYTWRWQPKDYDQRLLPLVGPLQEAVIARINELPAGQPYLTLTAERYKRLQELRSVGCLSDRLRVCPDENFTKPFGRILHRAQIRGLTFHDLRRTWITGLMENGLSPHEAMKAAGHATVDTTMRFYTATRDTLNERIRVASQTVIGATGLEPATS